MNSFRQWLISQWLDHIDEVIFWTGKVPQYTAQDYFAKYKWWLRREFRYQLDKTNYDTHN